MGCATNSADATNAIAADAPARDERAVQRVLVGDDPEEDDRRDRQRAVEEAARRFTGRAAALAVGHRGRLTGSHAARRSPRPARAPWRRSTLRTRRGGAPTSRAARGR